MSSCSLHAPGFSLRHTMECGQYFRWSVKDGLYTEIGRAHV